MDANSSETENAVDPRRRRWVTWALGGVAVVVVLAIAGPFIYINFIQEEAPDELTLPPTDDSTTTTVAGAGGQPDSVDGTWTVSDGSTAGYRVDEILLGQSTTAVGRTTNVTGSFELAGTTVTSAEFSIDMASIRSDQDRRDGQFKRIMDTDANPNATFKLTEPIDLGSVPADGVTIEVVAKGDLTLKGITKSVEIPLKVRKSGDTVDVVGSFDLKFSDWGIDRPNVPVAQVGDDGSFEFLLRFTKGTTVTTTTTTAPPAGGGEVTVPANTVPPLGF